MRILLLSTLVYLTGVAVVLFLRPALMFRADGSWKEFGIQGGDAVSSDVSPFPFWLFCMSWAIVSFFLSRFVLSVFVGGGRGGEWEAGRGMAENAGGIAMAASAASLFNSSSKKGWRPEENSIYPLSPPAELVPPAKKKQPKPGYYKLNTVATKKDGTPRYIYLGAELPSDSSSSSEED